MVNPFAIALDKIPADDLPEIDSIVTTIHSVSVVTNCNGSVFITLPGFFMISMTHFGLKVDDMSNDARVCISHIAAWKGGEKIYAR